MILALPAETLVILEQQRQQLIISLQSQKRQVQKLQSQIQSLQADMAQLNVDLQRALSQPLQPMGNEWSEVTLLWLVAERYTHQLLSSAQYRVMESTLATMKQEAADAESHLQYLEESLHHANQFFERLREKQREESLRVAARELVYQQMRLDQQRLNRLLLSPPSPQSIRPMTSILERFMLPVAGEYTSFFGWRTHPVFGDARHHDGVDIAAAEGTPVVSAKSGVVKMADWMGGYGLAILVDHGNGYQTLYAHLSQLHVQTGETVAQGQVIGAVGSTGLSTGPHLHFEIRRQGQPVDPLPYLRG